MHHFCHIVVQRLIIIHNTDAKVCSALCNQTLASLIEIYIYINASMAGIKQV